MDDKNNNNVDSVDEFVLVEELAKKTFPKSKTPICDYVAMHACECDPEEPVISLDIARQLEYNSRFYETINKYNI